MGNLDIKNDDLSTESSYEDHIKNYYNELLLEASLFENDKQERIELLDDINLEYKVYLFLIIIRIKVLKENLFFNFRKSYCTQYMNL